MICAPGAGRTFDRGSPFQQCPTFDTDYGILSTHEASQDSLSHHTARRICQFRLQRLALLRQ